MSLKNQISQNLNEAFHTVRNASVKICAPLNNDDQNIQAMPDVSPTKWHLAHTTWFFEEFVLREALPDCQPFNVRFTELFNSYYNSVGPQFTRSLRGSLSRPTVDEVYSYRAWVDEQMLNFMKLNRDEKWRQRIIVGLNHEQQHQELMLTDIKYNFSINPLKPVYDSDCESDIEINDTAAWVLFDGGLQNFGRTASSEVFSFDNEGPQHQYYLQPFALSSNPVTNGQYLRFIQAKGYDSPDWWLSDGWNAAREQKWTAPLYWTSVDGQWFEFSLNGLRPLNINAPVSHISFYEADAFARWSGYRLPTEYEWEFAAGSAEIDENKFWPQSNLPHNHDVSHSDSLNHMFGSGWQWTSSSYAAYPGFAPAAGALGEYNGKFMCNQYVLRGGSSYTPRNHIRRTYRNFFYPTARWQKTIIRLAKSP